MVVGGSGERRRGHPAIRMPLPGLLGRLLHNRPFRRLWLVLGLSAFGDWLGLLAAPAYAASQVSLPAAQGLAFGTVIAVQLLPALLLGPVAGIIADRFDRRLTMATVDLLRFALLASIPIAGLFLDGGAVVVWAATAMFVIQAAALLWMPAKEAAVPNLVPAGQLELANQLTLVTTYGVTPLLGALAFTGLAAIPGIPAVEIALVLDALTFLASALVVLYGIREISGRAARSEPGRGRQTPVRDLITGVRYVAADPLVRGLVVGILGAFAGAGIVIGTAKFYALSLGGGDATFAILFAALFTGFGIGITAGPRLVGRLSRRRWFALSIILAGIAVVGLAAAPRLTTAIPAAVVVGSGAGMAFLAGITLIGREVTDDVRGRVFAFLQTAVRVILLLAIAASGVAVGLGSSRRIQLGPAEVDISTTRVLLFYAGVTGIALGTVALRQIDDRPGVAVLPDLVWSLLHLHPRTPPPQLGTEQRRGEDIDDTTTRDLTGDVRDIIDYPPRDRRRPP